MEGWVDISMEGWVEISMEGWVEISTWRRWVGPAYKSATGDPDFSCKISAIVRHLTTSQFK